MAVYKETIMLKSHGKTPTYVNITPQVREAIEKRRNPEWNLHSNFSTYNMFSIFCKNLYMTIMKRAMNSYRKT